MRFLLDQNADRRLAPYLRSLGHDVTVVAVDYPPGLSDADVLAIAHREGRIIITNDRDFGDLVFRQQAPHAGVIYFRLDSPTFAGKRDRLATVLADYGDRLHQLFITVTESSIRTRGRSQ